MVGGESLRLESPSFMSKTCWVPSSSCITPHHARIIRRIQDLLCLTVELEAFRKTRGKNCARHSGWQDTFRLY